MARTFRSRLFGVCLGLLIASSLVQSAQAENWPQWRGPRNDGVSSETGLPTTWSATENVLWKLPLPGPAGATPVVWEDRIFLTSAKGQDLVLICADTSGKLLWERKLGTGDETVRGDEGNSASPSPSTDGKHVWAMLSTGELACYDFDGNEVWKFNMQERYGKFSIQFGMTSTPVLDGDRLYIQLLHTNYYLLAAVDKATGKDIWKHERQSDAKAECEHSYASPLALPRRPARVSVHARLPTTSTAHRLDDGSRDLPRGWAESGRATTT
jgi:outer membrane protein assembly factor BamB